MITVLVIDDDREWIKFVIGVFDDVVVNDFTATDIDLTIISEKKLKKHAKKLSKPFVIVTGEITMVGQLQAYRLGAARYVTRDYRAERLQALVNEILQ